MHQKKLGIIGIGKIGSTLLKRIMTTNALRPDEIMIFDINDTVLKKYADQFNIAAAKSNVDLARSVKYVLLAVLPQVIDKVLTEISDVMIESNILISIAAGVSLKHIKKFLKNDIGLFRVMTNTPALVGEAATAIAYNKHIFKEDLEFVKSIFRAVGIVVELDEIHLDAVTGLSGSGPAYIFIIIEALADGGVKMGLPRDIAQKLAAQTVLGSAKLLLKTQKHPGELKDMVATPGGTTITAIHEIESAKLRATLIRAVEAATMKSKSLNSSF
ncbi:MAG: pyrroline-5-carboxylate reductase [Promethearchaeota archaeon]